MTEGSLKKIFEDYGRNVTVVYGDGVTPSISFKAFLQPLRYKNKIYLEGVLTQTGYVDEGHYLYIGPSEYSLNNLPGGTQIHFGEHKLFVKRAETVYLRDEKLYVWAVLQTWYAEGEEWSV